MTKTQHAVAFLLGAWIALSCISCSVNGRLRALERHERQDRDAINFVTSFLKWEFEVDGKKLPEQLGYDDEPEAVR